MYWKRTPVALWVVLALSGAGGEAPSPAPPRLPVPPVALPELLLEPGALEPADVLLDVSATPGAVPGVPAGLRPTNPRWQPEGFRVARGVRALQRELGALGLDPARRVVVCGDERRPQGVALAFWLLEWAGCRDVRVLAGDCPAAGERARVTARRPVSFQVAPRTHALASLADVRALYGRPGTEIVDVRDGGDWISQGYVFPALFSAGHVPHGLPFDFSTLLAGGAGFGDAAAQRASFARLGPRWLTPVDLSAEFIVYGEDAHDPRAALGYFMLRRMGVRARVFSGGWRAWRAAGREPVVQVVTAAQVRALLEPTTRGARPAWLIDLRIPGEYRVEHVPGAVNLEPQEFVARLPLAWRQRGGGSRAHTPLVFYCYGRECPRSRTCATLAARAGFRRLYWFRDGITAWRQQGYPTSPPVGPTPAPGRN